MKHDESRRAFLQAMAASTCLAGLSLQAHAAQQTTIQGFDDTNTTLQYDMFQDNLADPGQFAAAMADLAPETECVSLKPGQVHLFGGGRR